MDRWEKKESLKSTRNFASSNSSWPTSIELESQPISKKVTAVGDWVGYRHVMLGVIEE